MMMMMTMTTTTTTTMMMMMIMFLWTHKEVALAPHPVVGLVFQKGGEKCRKRSKSKQPNSNQIKQQLKE